MKIDITKNDDSTVTITGEIPVDVFETYRSHAVSHVAEKVEVPGFRKGKAPADVLEKHIGEEAILEEMAQHAIGDAYPKIITEHKIDAIGRPEVTITKIAKGNPLGFKLTTAVIPEIELPDYKKIISKGEKEESPEEVTDEDVNNTIEEIRRSRAVKKESTQATEGTEAEGKEEPIELPVLDDAFAQSLGNFQTVDELRTKIKENMSEEKKFRAKEKWRVNALESIASETKVTIPKILIDAEIDRMLYRMQSDIANMGLSIEEYIKHTGKSFEALRMEFRADAEKRVKFELMMQEIARKESITPSNEEVEAEIKRVVEAYPGTTEDRVRGYVENMLTNQKVLEFIEGLSK